MGGLGMCCYSGVHYFAFPNFTWCGSSDYYFFRYGDGPVQPVQPGFVFFPELLLPTSPLSLFPELAFYP
jgi:hypothetical protein